MKKILTILLLSLIASCGNNPVDKPEKLIDEDIMVDVFYDLALLEAIKAHSPATIQNGRASNKYIYKKYSIDSLQFAQSNRYYASDIKQYKKMYARVGKRLERNKKQLDSLNGNVKPKPLPDTGGVVK